MIKLIVLWLMLGLEIVPGTCINNEQDGREAAGYYISYKGTDAEEGDDVITVIMNDLNNECLYRMDFVK